MPSATSAAAAILTLLAVTGCSDTANPDQNVVITNDIPPGADIEALPPDEAVDAAPELNGATPQERGDGDDMVNVIDDTDNRSE